MHKPCRVFSILMLTVLITGMLFSVCAYGQDAETEKYVKEVRFFAGETQEEAAAWLSENGVEHLNSLVSKIEKIDGVLSIERSGI